MRVFSYSFLGANCSLPLLTDLASPAGAKGDETAKVARRLTTKSLACIVDIESEKKNVIDSEALLFEESCVWQMMAGHEVRAAL